MRLWTSFFFTAGLVSAGVQFAAVRPAAASVELVFQAQCSGCHSLSRAVRPVKAMKEADRRPHLEKFLADHHTRDAAERSALIDYLLKAAVK